MMYFVHFMISDVQLKAPVALLIFKILILYKELLNSEWTAAPGAS